MWAHMEAALAADVDEAAAAARAEEEALLRGGRADYVHEVTCSIDGAHPASVICVRLWPGRDAVLTGSGAVERCQGLQATRGWRVLC